MNLHHLPDSVQELLPEWKPEGIEVGVFREETLMGTAGPLRVMESILSSGTFWVLNADSLLEIEPARMLDRHRSSGAIVTMALKPYRKSSGYAPVEIDPDGRIVRINGKPEGGKPGTPHIFVGAQLAEPAILASIPPDRPCESTSEVYPRLINQGARLIGWVTDAPWVEIGNPAAYLRVSLELLNSGQRGDQGMSRQPSGGGFQEDVSGRKPDRSTGPVLLGKDGSFGPGTEFAGGVVAGRRVRIGAGARIRRSILWDGAAIGADANLDECIIAGGWVGEGEALHRKIVVPEGPGGRTVTELPPGPTLPGE
jgi:mannose-1-phosphate guanylyltransferase/phosphomannomutase